jgi:hypothetical protein
MARTLLPIIPILMMFACQTPLAQPNPTSDAGYRFGIDYLWYGINQYYKEGNLPTLAAYRVDLNATVVRFDVYWYFIQPEQGVFDWTKTDAAVRALPSNVQILFTLYCTAPWAIKERRDRSYRRITTILPSAAPVVKSDYYDFIYALADRYKGRVGYYQAENEVYGARGFWMGTPNEYVDVLKTAYGAVKAADPSAKVLPAGIAFEAVDVTQPIAPQYKGVFDFINLVYSVGRRYFDIADAHLYYSLASVPDRLQWLRTLMSANGYSKPIWVSETGGLDSRAYGNPADDAEQSIDLVKRYVLAFAGDAERVFWLSVHKTKDAEAAPWADMKLTEDAAAAIPKPAYHTLKLLISKLNGSSSVAVIPDGYKFTVAGETVLVLWNDTPAMVDVSSQFSVPSVLVTHIVTNVGNPIPQIQTSAANAVSIDREPVIVEKAP